MIRPRLSSACARRFTTKPDGPKPLMPPTPPPPPESRNLSLLQRFQTKLVREAEAIEEMRKNPTAPTAHPVFKYEAKLDARIKELERVEFERKAAGLKTKLGPVAMRMRSGLSGVLDSEKNELERQALLKEFGAKGQFDDLKEIARKGDKLWTAKETMTPSQTSPLVPNIPGKSLSGVETDIHTLIKGKRASLVTFAFTAMGEPHIKSYLQPFQTEFSNNPAVGIVQLNVEEDWAKKWALTLFTPWIRRKVPVEMHGNYLIHTGDISSERNRIGMGNRLLGWVHLVDASGSVRWSAHGPAKEGELKTLLESTLSLLSSSSQ
ncbi:Mitochondrial ATPase complex subunit atp10 [Chytriomyces hyalinus]|nr:Mitochondrial ATPase complex subunit atp10 [Chytriomyces hyalinus]